MKYFLHCNVKSISILIHEIIFIRSDADSFRKGIINEQKLYRLETRRLVSMKVCGIGLLMEFIGGFFRMLNPVLRIIGLKYSFIPHLLDALMVFVVVPVIHLLNDESTKTFLVQKEYYKALKSIFSFKQMT